ncbi:AI-2E family transporter [Salipaludibacillus daqingensis]|uniref:AI-2E family transporter n=1 Tax=Salipaludibacillus daqingensis TaxID=3041001 RepID=UPI0024754FAC|nr:AI-2E family transporter [Salipaludibacillus daqingensis]
MFQSRFFKLLAAILVILLIILVGTEVSFIFRPLVVFFQTLFIPFLIAGVLFYLLRPIVHLLHMRKVPKVIAILIIYIGMISVITMLVLLVGPILQGQVMRLVDNAPMLFEELRKLLIQIEDNEWFSRFQETENFSIEEITNNLTNYLTEAFDFISSNIAGFIGGVINILLIFIVVPFVLFYLLKDGEKAPNQLLRFLPEKQQSEGHRILEDMDDKLSSYIQGQIIVSVCVGVLMYISFLIIGIEYSLILALIAMFTNVVPFVGPWIGTVPAVIVAIIDSPLMVLWVILAIVIVQQIESNLISPQVMGRKLAVHPLTIIVLILVAGRFAGLLGLILAVPTYAVAKVIISHMYRLFQLRKKIDKEFNKR